MLTSNSIKCLHRILAKLVQMVFNLLLCFYFYDLMFMIPPTLRIKMLYKYIINHVKSCQTD